MAPSRAQVFALLDRGTSRGYGSMRTEEIARDLVERHRELKGVDPRDLTVRIVAWKRGERTDAEDPCWSGFEQHGTKEKDGKTVPNCVKADEVERAIADAAWRADCLSQRMDACENKKV